MPPAVDPSADHVRSSTKLHQATFTDSDHNHRHQHLRHAGADDYSSQTTLPRAIDDDDAGDGRKGRLPKEASSGTEASCGWGCLRPRWAQRFLRPKWVLFWLCWAGALQGMLVNGFVNVVITSIERRFELRSTETGLIAGAYDIASFLCLVPVSYFGGAGHKPRWLGWGLVLLGLGSLLFAVPHFAAGLYAFDAQSELRCAPSPPGGATDSPPPDCHADYVGSLSNYKYVFILAQLLNGAGAAPLYTLGVTYLDENVQTKMSSIYVGIYYSMAIVGPAIGYLAGGQFLKIYTDVGRVNMKSIDVSPTSNVWIGAWWIGFLVSGLLSLIAAIPILGFPSQLPGFCEIRAQKISEAHQVKEESNDVNQLSFGKGVKDMPKAVKFLLRNPTFMFLNLGGAFEGLLLSGFAAFLPKFIEFQFSLTASWAALLVGAVTVSSGGGGTFLGGYLVKRFELRCAGIIKMCVICALISLAASLVFVMHCPNIPFAGVNRSYGNDTDDELGTIRLLPELSSPCSSQCRCSMDNYDPVCGVNNVLYYSPCHAGCAEVIHVNHQLAFANCSCIPGVAQLRSVGETEAIVMATREPCVGFCNTLPAFLCLIFVVSLFTFLSSMPALSATLRCVVEQQRSFALGIQWIVVRVLGSIPAPIIFGALMDATCILWQDSCGQQGSCRAYDNASMSRYILAISLVGKALSTTFFFLAWFLYRPPPNSSDANPGNGPEAGVESRVASVSFISGAAVPDVPRANAGAGDVEDGQSGWPRVDSHTSAGL